MIVLRVSILKWSFFAYWLKCLRLRNILWPPSFLPRTNTSEIISPWSCPVGSITLFDNFFFTSKSIISSHWRVLYMRVKIVDWAVIKINFQSHYSGKNFFIRSNFLPRYIRPQKYPNDDDVGMSNCDSINGSKLLTANLIFFQGCSYFFSGSFLSW